MKCVVTTNFSLNGSPFENPRVKSPLKGWDYFIFSNISEINRQEFFNGWKVMPRKLISNHPIYTAKYYKYHIHRELPEYNRSIYVDAWLNPNSQKDWDSLQEPFYLKRHLNRSCIYDELRAITKFRRDTKENMQKVKSFLEAEGFPKGYGLWETQIQSRDLKNKEVNKICEDLYNLMENFSYRDQTMLSYILWKNNFTPNDSVLNNRWRTEVSRSVARKTKLLKNGQSIFDNNP
jgi:hypothetical protein